MLTNIKYLEQTYKFQLANKELGVLGNPNLPKLESFDEKYYKLQVKKFEKNTDDPYISDKVLG
jgi:hypothetical protein